MLLQRDIVLVGLSGGPDSVCLLHLLRRIQERLDLTLHATYVNHNLRPDEVPGEISFCEKTCRELGVNFVLKSVDVVGYQRQRGLSRQEAGRELRYKAFDEATAELGASKIALAHLCAHLKRRGFGIIDCQMETRHLASLGARPIPRREFTARLDALCAQGDVPGHWPTTAIDGHFRRRA